MSPKIPQYAIVQRNFNKKTSQNDHGWTHHAAKPKQKNNKNIPISLDTFRPHGYCIYIMFSASQVTNTLNNYGFTTDQARGLTVILDKYHGTLVTQTDLKQAIDKLSQRIEQVAEQVVQLEKNNTIRFDAMEKSNTARFEAMEKNNTVRFEAIEKRFEQMQQNMNIRFEAMEKSNAARFEAIEKRFEQMEKSNTVRFEAIEKRFEQMQENMTVRFDAINKQLGSLRWFLVASTAFMGTLMTIGVSLLAINIF